MVMPGLQNWYYCKVTSVNHKILHNLFFFVSLFLFWWWFICLDLFFFARLGTATGSISGNRDLIVIFKCSQKCDSLCNSKHGVSLVK